MVEASPRLCYMAALHWRFAHEDSMADHVHGEMDIREQESVFRGFIKLTIRTCIVIVVVLAFMAAFLT